MGSSHWPELMEAVDLFVDGDVDDICFADVENCVDDSVDVDIDVDAEILCGVWEESCQDLLNHAPEVSVVGSTLFTYDDSHITTPLRL